VLSGSVKGLYPGAHAPLRVRLRNRAPYAVRVLEVTAKAANARRGCRHENLRVGRFGGHVLIAGRRSRTVTLRLVMQRGAPDACRNAVFRLAFNARAVRP
jgi:hypothetical protein